MKRYSQVELARSTTMRAKEMNEDLEPDRQQQLQMMEEDSKARSKSKSAQQSQDFRVDLEEIENIDQLFVDELNRDIDECTRDMEALAEIMEDMYHEVTEQGIVLYTLSDVDIPVGISPCSIFLKKPRNICLHLLLTIETDLLLWRHSSSATGKSINVVEAEIEEASEGIIEAVDELEHIPCRCCRSCCACCTCWNHCLCTIS